MARGRHTTLPPPYLKRVWIDPHAPVDRAEYPFCLPLFARASFELQFDAPVTILVGENGVGKSTLLEGIALQGQTQVVMATHSPILMALPDAVLLQMSRGGLAPVLLEETDHYRLTREFILDPHGITAAMLDK